MSTEPRDLPEGKRPVPARSTATWIGICVAVLVVLVVIWLIVR